MSFTIDRIKSNSGFTLTEILVALAIMTIGFLSMSLMQFLSLRQSGLAEKGTIATNIVQYISDRDMAEVRRYHLLNSRVFLDGQSGKPITTQDDYCDGGTDDPCPTCPCNPLNIFTSNTATNNTEATCTEIDVKNFDPAKIQYETTQSNCSNSEFYIVRQVVTNVDTTVVPNEIIINISYGIQSQKQFDNFNMNSDTLKIANTILFNSYQTSAHLADWSNFVPSWTNPVVVPHIP